MACTSVNSTRCVEVEERNGTVVPMQTKRSKVGDHKHNVAEASKTEQIKHRRMFIEYYRCALEIVHRAALCLNLEKIHKITFEKDYVIIQYSTKRITGMLFRNCFLENLKQFSKCIRNDTRLNLHLNKLVA